MGKRLKSTVRRSPPPSTDKEFDLELEVPANPFEKSPILIGKNVDFRNFTIEAPAFHIEELFENMGWILIATLEEYAYPWLMKEFYKNMAIIPRSGDISFLIKNKRIVINKAFIRDIFRT